MTLKFILHWQSGNILLKIWATATIGPHRWQLNGYFNRKQGQGLILEFVFASSAAARSLTVVLWKITLVWSERRISRIHPSCQLCCFFFFYGLQLNDTKTMWQVAVCGLNKLKDASRLLSPAHKCKCLSTTSCHFSHACGFCLWLLSGNLKRCNAGDIIGPMSQQRRNSFVAEAERTIKQLVFTRDF